jgi:DNA-binding XRE family transcriptional regulator
VFLLLVGIALQLFPLRSMRICIGKFTSRTACNYYGMNGQGIIGYCWYVGSNLRNDIQRHVALLLRQARLKRELSLNVLAEKAGLSRQMVSYVEQEKRNPSLDVLLRITEVLEIKLEDLLRTARNSSLNRGR